ncbi:cation:proton antiporter [Streptomyces sp. NPDC093546]|uniref:cation:proton antiporter n=1 Tax=Streptomyces sp. NPDC093546 TaxID=3366040 RepID=UPI00381C3672
MRFAARRDRRALYVAIGATVVLPLAVIALAAARASGPGSGAARGGAPAGGLDGAGHFLLAAAVVLVAAHLGGAALKALGQPRVIGEICAGLLMGPTLLGWLAPGATAWLFPAQARDMMSGLAQLGLVVFMFGVGRELSTMRLRGAAARSVLISQASLFVPFAAGVVIALPLVDGHLGPAGHPLAFVLFVGCALSITAFPVLARILSDIGATKTRTGQLGLFCAAVGDAGSWLLLTAILALSHGAGLGPLAVQALLLAVVVAVCLGPVRLLLARWAEKRDRADGGGGVVAMLVAGVMAAAALTAALGVHQLIGAMLVGLMWPRHHRVAAVAVEGMAGVAKTILLPFFFFGFGLTVNLRDLSWGAGTLLTLVGLLVFAIVSKVAGAGVCARLTGMPWPAALGLGVLLNARGLTELVVIQIGREAGLIDHRMAGLLTLVALVTTVVTSPVLRWMGPRALGEQPQPDSAKETVPAAVGAGEGPGRLDLVVRSDLSDSR